MEETIWKLSMNIKANLPKVSLMKKYIHESMTLLERRLVIWQANGPSQDFIN